MTCWYCGRFVGAEIAVWKGRDSCADCAGPRKKIGRYDPIEECRRCEDQWYRSLLENGYCWNCVKLLAAIAEDLAERAPLSP